MNTTNAHHPDILSSDGMLRRRCYDATHEATCISGVACECCTCDLKKFTASAFSWCVCGGRGMTRHRHRERWELVGVGWGGDGVFPGRNLSHKSVRGETCVVIAATCTTPCHPPAAPRTHLHIHSPSYSLTYSINHLAIHLDDHSTHSLTHSLIHSPTHTYRDIDQSENFVAFFWTYTSGSVSEPHVTTSCPFPPRPRPLAPPFS